jgi:putative methyltransferase (TIGR04325 family)
MFTIIRSVRELPIFRNLFAVLVGYNRPFATLNEAAAAIAGYKRSGHEHAESRELHLTLAQSARPSDYPALFHIQPLLPQIRNVYDFGGNVGNLFYGYSKYLTLPPDLIWTVYDLPKNIDAGARLAMENCEDRLRFTEKFAAAEEADLFIASGSLHYFDRPLWQMIGDLKKRPRCILINRTPLTDGAPLATIQDWGGEGLFSCMLYNRSEMIRSFEQLGYSTVDTWQAAELSLIIPGYPDRSASTYSGMFFSQS